jgi:hypothetical protein
MRICCGHPEVVTDCTPATLPLTFGQPTPLEHFRAFPETFPAPVIFFPVHHMLLQ